MRYDLPDGVVFGHTRALERCLETSAKSQNARTPIDERPFDWTVPDPQWLLAGSDAKYVDPIDGLAGVGASFRVSPQGCLC